MDGTGSRKQLSVYLLTNLFLQGSRALVDGLQAQSPLAFLFTACTSSSE